MQHQKFFNLKLLQKKIQRKFNPVKKINPQPIEKEPPHYITTGIKKILALPKNIRLIILIAPLVFALAIFIASVCSWTKSYKNTEKIEPLTQMQLMSLDSILDEFYPMQRTEHLKQLPYPVTPVKLQVYSGAAILIDASNGCILYEKNADDLIPPASLTKLFVMYIVLKDVAEGKTSLDNIVPLPERSWAINLPSDASLMHLGQGQQVTLRELLQGLAVASGNDAAIAVAYYISGSLPAFVERMNQECEELGLTHTHFVEPSGYDENNITTARELAEFARIYITKYPESIKQFHSLKNIRYPLQKNLPSWQKNLGDAKAVFQKNTNPLLGTLYGVDGIKTGFIYESGYNLALTAQRNNNRFISVTMRGPGQGSAQGNAYRVKDGTTMMEWAFNSFADYTPVNRIKLEYTVPVPGAQKHSGKFVNLVPAWTNSITVPHVYSGTAVQNADSVKAFVTIPKYIFGETKAGAAYGQIQYKLGDIVLETVPLVADRTITKAGASGRFWGRIVAYTLK